MSEMSNKRIALFVLTAGRPDYLDTTIKSIDKYLKGNIVSRIIFDNSDSPNASYTGYQTIAVPSFDLPYGYDRHAKAMKFIFDMHDSIDADVVCFFEEDWELQEEVDLDYISKYLTEEFSQIRLFRQQDYNVAGIVDEDFSIVRSDSYMFTLNPSLFYKSIMKIEYPTYSSHMHEWTFGQIVNKPFMVYKNGTPIVAHIGKVSVEKSGETN